MEKRVLIVGYGSIGRRHARVASGLGHGVGVVSRHAADCPYPVWTSLRAAPLDSFDVVVIASTTDEHLRDITAIRGQGFSGRVMVEKPLFHAVVSTNVSPQDVYVGYNLRFHPALRDLATFLENEKILSIQAYAGQYLPSWRPGTDYAESYSAHKSRGGGVLRDLSHELDMVQHLGGGWRRVAAVGGKYSSLKGDSDDVFLLLLECQRCPVVSVQVNYLDRSPRRCILVNTDQNTYLADLISQTLTVNNKNPQQYALSRDATYEEQMKALCGGEGGILCGFNEGFETVRLIDAAEEAARERVWVLANASR